MGRSAGRLHGLIVLPFLPSFHSRRFLSKTKVNLPRRLRRTNDQPAAAGDHHSIQFSTFPAHVAPPALAPSPAPRSHLYYGSNVYRTDRHYGVRIGGTALAWVRLSVRPLDIPCSMMIRTKSDRPFLPLMIPRSLARSADSRPKMGRVEIERQCNVTASARGKSGAAAAAAEGVIAEPEGMARRGGRGRGQSVNVMNGKLWAGQQ